jgi:hypothetical protein
METCGRLTRLSGKDTLDNREQVTMTGLTQGPSGKLVRIVEKTDGLVMAECETVCIAVWRKDSVLARFNVQRSALVDLAGRFPGKTGFLCVVEPTSGPPGDDVRKATSRMFDELGTQLKAIAMIIEGTGFRSALVRSVASGIVMLSRKRDVPISYLATVNEGVRWMAQHMTIRHEEDVAHAVEEARAQLDPA